MSGPSTTRRGLLVAAGTVALAGCSRPDTGDSRKEIPPTELPDVPDPDETRPILEDDIPVTIERSKLEEEAARATDLLGQVPIPLGETEIPNGYIREELTRAADMARSHIESARAATTRLSAIQELRRARSDARFAAEGWAFVDGGRTVAELKAERQEVIEGADAFRSAYEYVGSDPVCAVVVHAHVESLLGRVRRDRDPDVHHDSSDLLRVAEWAEHAESAQTSLDGARYLSEQFESSLPQTTRTLDARFDAAADALAADLGRRRNELPAEPTAGERNLARALGHRLRRDAESALDDVRDRDGTATPVTAATGALTAFLAYERLLTRLDDGERFRIEDGADVRAARSNALEAIRTALEEARRPVVARGVLVDAATLVTYADDGIARVNRRLNPGSLNDVVRRYVTATLRARSVPAACDRVLEALES